ncbi:MAG TPA: hypothetical protein VMW56_23635 [Candidatus Margulisiibacteriota bacterium]|nr:hypothetical protein [Candidatus Margulisiibacteriota bacterium]
MKRCLNEQTLLQLAAGDGTAGQRQHLRLCADCAERYDSLAEDLDTLRHILTAPPPPRPATYANPFRVRWIPVAAAAAALLAVLVSGPRLRQPAPAPTHYAAPGASVAAFAADVSAALFADSAPTATVALATGDASYLQAALDAGPCTRDRYFNGECDDQLSALLFEGE